MKKTGGIRRTWVIAIASCLTVAAIAALVIGYRQPIPEITRPPASSFASELVERGSKLALLGDCAVCHTKDSGGFLSGGRALPTPFGTIYTTNITPDEVTGIGRWSLDAFRRAIREGVGRDGQFLYPAFPYEHYTRTTDGDIEALYAYLMTRPAVQTKPDKNDLIFPLGFRPLLAGWNLLFLRKGAWQPDPKLSPELNRGAYLVEGLGHCGACHSPRNIAGGEERSRAFDGGVAEGWQAPALNGLNRALRPWTKHQLFTYLRTGIDDNHSAAAGPMGPVTTSLSRVPEGDVAAIAAYVAFLMGNRQEEPAPEPVDRSIDAERSHPLGAILFKGACAGCHGPGAPLMEHGRPQLSLSTDVRADEPRNVIMAILNGMRPEPGLPGAVMPAFDRSFTDQQVADLAAYVRARFSTRPPWPSLDGEVARARKESAE